jgi:hypothetical protein
MAMKRYAAPEKKGEPLRKAPAEEHGPARAVGTVDMPAVHALDVLPSASTARALRQGTVRHMQQRHGNAFVQRALDKRTLVQRDDGEREEQTPAEAPTAATQAPTETAEAPTRATQTPVETGEAPTEAAAQGNAISGDGSSVRADAGGVTIEGARLGVNAGTVALNAGMVEVSGVLRTPTIIADTVMGASYTPGAGNVW